MLLPRLVSLLVALSSTVSAFYLPGTAPRDYRDAEDVELDVNVLKPGLGYETENLVRSSQASIIRMLIICAKQSLINCMDTPSFHFLFVALIFFRVQTTIMMRDLHSVSLKVFMYVYVLLLAGWLVRTAC
jgi:hypothetical protein